MRPSSWRERSTTAKYCCDLGELPVGDLAHGCRHRGGFDRRREIGGERAGVVGRGAEHAGVVLGNAGEARGLRIGRGDGGVGGSRWGGGHPRRSRLLGGCKRCEERDACRNGELTETPAKRHFYDLIGW